MSVRHVWFSYFTELSIESTLSPAFTLITLTGSFNWINNTLNPTHLHTHTHIYTLDQTNQTFPPFAFCPLVNFKSGPSYIEEVTPPSAVATYLPTGAAHSL